MRDEAARARKAKRLVPILLDRARVPKAFGPMNAEDFTAWNGAAGAPQMDALFEMLKARLEGRAPEGGVLARWRSAKARVKLVSVGVVALESGRCALPSEVRMLGTRSHRCGPRPLVARSFSSASPPPVGNAASVPASAEVRMLGSSEVRIAALRL